MVVIHKGRAGRKESGGKYLRFRKKRVFETGSRPTETLISDKDFVKVEKGKFGHVRTKLLYAQNANLYDPKTKSFSKTKIVKVLESQANRHYARRNIIVKGSIIETEKGKARVTSRPGQDGTVNAVMI